MAHRELSSCGVGFVASLEGHATHDNLRQGLLALENLEHRGGSAADLLTSDGAGILTDIPWELYGIAEGTAVASLFLSREATARIRSLRIFEETFQAAGLEILSYREPPLNPDVLSEACRQQRPQVLLAFIRRPPQCTTRYAFEKLLYAAKQATRSRLRHAGIVQQFFFTSLSAGTVVYKALTPSKQLSEFYLDLQNPVYRTRFTLLHRRFSTNTATSWDKAQPFRVVAHNGEINTIAGNRAWAYARERALGIQEDELLTHRGISDSGSVNEMIEALMFRSSIPHAGDILAIMMPRADSTRPFYRFWSRAMEPWDGPALFAFSDGRTVGARLDRSGFRPCRWARTEKHFYLSSEAGSFELAESKILAKGALSGGHSVNIDLRTGRVHFDDASDSGENKWATFNPRLKRPEELPVLPELRPLAPRLALFGYSEEDMKKVLLPTIRDGKEPIGSMGDTARLAALSSERRSLFDYFFQNFAQVTNPPLDYLRERLVTDMTVVLGRKPNIFEPKELVPMKRGVELDGPVLSLARMEFLRSLESESSDSDQGVGAARFDTTFRRAEGVAGLRAKLELLKAEARVAVVNKKSIFLLSDRAADQDNPPIPSVLVLAALDGALNEAGMRLRVSFVVETGEVFNTHQLSVLIGFGAAAVCPYLALEVARTEGREAEFVKALEQGLLKILSKMGVSVLQSYQGSGLFTILGFGADLHAEFFPRHRSWVGGLSLEALVERRLRETEPAAIKALLETGGLHRNYLYREHPKELEGERHAFTLPRSKIIHALVAESGAGLGSPELFEAFLKAQFVNEPVSFRHLLRPRVSAKPLELPAIEPREAICRRFGSGAMSFGAISAESQRDLFLAMRELGARSNSGEGGENPYYFRDGTRAHTKQVASGRFGVTAEYLITSDEIQVKIAQGAKPGEGGQLMASKVGPETARARYSDEGVDLISPPPMHDIYSIEDLKQLIFELRQLKPGGRVSVKLVAGENVGTVAVGVAKAGADIIHISGHDGGTGAAPLSSMKHAGLPWEIGLVECHQALLQERLRHRVTLRVDGGLTTGQDVVTAALLGAEEFDFGKLLLVAQGCIMARVCEKNTCPTGIATHDPKFKKRYEGSPEKIVAMLTHVAEDVRRHLASLGASSIAEIVGRSDLLEVHPTHAALVAERRLNLDLFLARTSLIPMREPNPFIEGLDELNARLVDDVRRLRQLAPSSEPVVLQYSVRPRDRAVLATLGGLIAHDRSRRRLAKAEEAPSLEATLAKLRFHFRGSAGQGFCVFLQEGFDVRLSGEANDSVAKSMSGGRLVVVPPDDFKAKAEANTILGNCALYGATGGTLYAHGIAGDRFAVRNSGATAVVEGVGAHACEYMTRGRVVILGRVGANVGAGMTGGELYMRRTETARLNADCVEAQELSVEDVDALEVLLRDYHRWTSSSVAQSLNGDRDRLRAEFVKVLPLAKLRGARVEGIEGFSSPPSAGFLHPTA